MRPTSRLLAALLATASIAAVPVSNTPTDITPATFGVAIPEGRTLVVIGQGAEQIHDDYVDNMGRSAAGTMTYIELHREPGRLQDTLDELTVMLSTERFGDSVLDVGLTMGPSPVWDTLKGSPAGPGAVAVAAGEYDVQLAMLAEWMNQLDTTVFLRIGYEFDLLGGQWGAPAQYAAGFRHMVDIFRAEGVDNAAYVWHSSGAFFRGFDYSGPVGVLGAADSSITGAAVEAVAGTRDPLTGSDLLPIDAYYPGEGYVDYFGVSYWDDACCAGRGNAEARAAYRQRTRELLDEASAMGLPLTIGEATPAYIGASSGEESVAYFEGLFDLIAEYDIRMLNMISQDWQAKSLWTQPHWNGFWPDARVHAYGDVCDVWVERTSDDRYVHGTFIDEAITPCASASPSE